MQEVSALYHEIISNPDHWYETRVVIGDGGDLVTEKGDRIIFGEDTIVVSRTGPDSGYPEDKVYSVNTNVQVFDKAPQIGQAISQEIEVRMDHPSGNIPRMAVVIPYVRAVGRAIIGVQSVVIGNKLRLSGHVTYQDGKLIFDAESNAVVQRKTLKMTNKFGELHSEWLQQGKFYIDTRETTFDDDGLEILTLHGYDVMMMGEQEYSDTNLNWPAKDIDIAKEIASQLRTQLDPRTIALMTKGYKLPLPTGYTLREVLGIIAGKYLGSFIVNEVGELRLVSILDMPRETRLLIDQVGDYITFGGDRIKV